MVEWYRQRKTEGFEKNTNVFQRLFCTTDPTWIVLGLNPCFRSERQATDLLSYGTALIIFEGYKQKTVKISQHQVMRIFVPCWNACFCIWTAMFNNLSYIIVTHEQSVVLTQIIAATKETWILRSLLRADVSSMQIYIVHNRHRINSSATCLLTR